MHGDTAGLESADPSSPGDPRAIGSGAADQWVTSPEFQAKLTAEVEGLIEWLEQTGEYKAAREVSDALERWKSLRQGQRSSQTAHGEAAQNAQVDAFPVDTGFGAPPGLNWPPRE